MDGSIHRNGRGEPRLRFTRRLDKIVELLVYLARRKPGRDQYQAVKLFYLADKEHFNSYGRPITYEIYYAMNYGPVATTVLSLIRGDKQTLKEAGIARLPIMIRKMENIFTLVEAEREVDYDVFSKSDLKVFDKVIKEYGDKSFDDLYRITHEHFAYKAAWSNKKKGDKRSLIFYEDMLEESPEKAEIIEDLEPIAKFVR